MGDVMARPKLFGFSEFKITRTPRWLFSGNASQPASHAVQGVFEVDLGAVDEHAVHFHLPCRAFRAEDDADLYPLGDVLHHGRAELTVHLENQARERLLRP